MRGMFLMVEAVRQLRGECGPRQVEDAQLACVHAMGGFFSHSATMILGRR
jgi:acetyl-CoA acetyltransferase